jgi:uncharacterized protein (DUF58 family)
VLQGWIAGSVSLMTIGVAHSSSSGIWVVLAVLLAIFVVLMVVIYLATRKRNADFTFTVGENERHEIRYRRSNWSGRMRITVDGDPTVGKFEFLGFPLTKKYDFRTGTTECHDVTIVKTRPLLVAWMRSQPVQAFVDGTLVATHS